MKQIAECFPPAARMVLPGGHDWPVWQALWENFLDRAFSVSLIFMSLSWKPTPAIQLSLATHAAAGIGLLALPGHWPWALGAVAINQSILIGAGLLPRTTLLGPNLNRLPAAAIARREIALTIDDGPEPGSDAARARSARRSRRQGQFFLHRPLCPPTSGAVPRDRCAWPPRRKSWRFPLLVFLCFRLETHARRHRRCAGNAGGYYRPGAALFPADRRPAQSLARSGAGQP